MLGAPHSHTALIYLGNVFLLLVVAVSGGAWAGFELFNHYIFPRLAVLTPGMSLGLNSEVQSAVSLRFALSVFILTTSLLLPGTLLYFKGVTRSALKPFQQPTHWQRLKELSTIALSHLRNFPDLVWIIATFFLSFIVSNETIFNIILVAFISAVYLCVRVLVKLIGKFGITSKFRLPLFLRIAASELSSRPTQSSLSLMLFCLSVCLVVFLLDLRGNIINQLTSGFSNGARPNIFVLDSPQEDIENVEKILNSAQASEVLTTRMTRARIVTVNGFEPDSWILNVKQSKEVTKRTEHLLNREQNLTTRALLTPEEEIVEGRFWKKDSEKTQLDEVSVESGLAETLNLNLNDTIVFNVQGVPVSAKITSIRKVQWQSFKPNFFFVLHPSLLDEAPYSGLITAAVPVADNRKEAINQLYKDHPGLTTIDADEFSKIAEKLINSAVEIVRYLSIMLFAGAFLNIILSAWNSFTLRARNFSLYRCIGANNKLVVTSCLTEYMLIALGGGLIGLAASWGLSASIEKVMLTTNDQLNTSSWPGLLVIGSVFLIALFVGSASAALILREAPLKNLKRPI
jgi:predicted lysophospholipase L1 biosynthesis ABC-type transport system permease subunit